MTKAPRIRVLLVDDHSLFRQTLRSLLAPYPNLELVGEASDGHEAVESVARLQPSVVVMDIHLQRMMDGIAATHLITIRIQGWRLLACPVIPGGMSSRRCSKQGLPKCSRKSRALMTCMVRFRGRQRQCRISNLVCCCPSGAITRLENTTS